MHGRWFRRASEQKTTLSATVRKLENLLAAVCLVFVGSAFSHAQTTTTLAISSAGSVVSTVASGTVVTLTASVTAGSSPVTQGLVKFCDAAATYCEDIHVTGTAQLTSAGTAVMKFRPAIGSHNYKAVFVGTSLTAGSSSTASSLTVTGLYGSTTTLSSTGGGSSYTLTSTVTGNRFVQPSMTGTVSFLQTNNSNAVLGTATIDWVAKSVTTPTPVNLLSNMGGPSKVVIADFNNDGIQDIATLNTGALTISIMLGVGDGTFNAAASPSTGTLTPVSMTVADFNHDGTADIAIANQGTGTGSLTILLGNGDGTFTSPSSAFTTNNYGITDIVAGDWNKDGIPDLAISNQNQNNLRIFLGTGDGSFGTPSSITTPAPAKLLTADFNGDGIADLAAMDTNSNSIDLFLGQGDGTFLSVASGIYLAGTPRGFFAADLNSDGIPDFVTSNESPSDPYPTKLFLGHGDGTFTVSSNPGVFWGTSIGAPVLVDLSIGDFNGDGITDISGDDGLNIVNILGNGDGSFQPMNHYLISNVTGIPSLAAGDFNGDGISDQAYISQVSDNASLTLGLTAAQQTATLSLPITPSSNSLYNIVASYSGDTNFAASVSSPVAIDNRIPTALLLSASPNDGLTAGQTSVLTATLSPYSSSGHSTDGETVSFYNLIGNSLLGTATFSNGVATLTTPPLGGGAYYIDAVYSGDSKFKPSTSNQTSIFIEGKLQPTVTLSTSPSIGIYGQSSTLTATIANYFTFDTPVIVFQNNGQEIGTGHITSGVAHIDISTLPVGINVLTAYFPGDRSNRYTVSNTIQYQVKLATQTVSSTSLAVTSAGAPATSAAFGTPITLTATVTAGGSAGSPGTVLFCDTTISASCSGTAILGTAQLTGSGTASLVVRPGIGAHSLQAIFPGTNLLASGKSAPSALTITGQYPTTITLRVQQSGSSITATPHLAAVAPRSARNLSGYYDIKDEANNTLFRYSFTVGDSTSPTDITPGLFHVSASPLTVGNKPFSATATDANHDGISDLIVANSSDNNVGVLLGNGDGTFQTQATYATGAGAFAVKTGDFNKDGNPDLAVTNFSTTTVSILLGNGDGTFQTQTTYAVGNGPASIAVADFDYDGNLDLAVANERDNTISVLLGNGDGTFQAQHTYATGGSPAAVASADFNKDGYADLAVANNMDGTVGILLNMGDGTFNAIVPYTVGTSPVSIATADYNADGNIDLAVANLSSNNFSVLPGVGDGTFQAQRTYSTGTNSGPEAIIAGDLAGLGNEDLAVVNSVANTVYVFRNNGSGTFDRVSGPFAVGKGSLSLAAGDWNCDGLLDMAIVNNSSNTLTEILNDSGPQLDLYFAPFALPGVHTLTTVYEGNTNYAGSTSAPVGTNAPKITTALALTNSSVINPSNYGQPITLTATLTPYSGGPYSTNGETITFMNGSTAIGTGTLTGGIATLTLSTLPVGVDTLSAVYSDDGKFTSSHATLTQTVRPATLTATASNATRIYGALNPAFTGTVSGTVNGDALTVSGTTTATLASLTGTYPITPTVSGTNVTNYTITTVNGTLTITKATPTIALITSASTSPLLGSVTFTANVTASGSGGAPTGSVSFYDGATLLGTGTLASGTATFTTSSLTVGTHTITGAYSGDTNYSNATSAALSQAIISKFTTALTLASSTNTSSSNYGQSVTLTATLAPYASGSYSTNGETITFMNGSAAIGSGSLISGKATLTLSTLPAGTNAITASYAGNPYFAASNATFAQTVQPAILTVTANNATRIYGAANPAFTGTVNGAVNGDSFTVTGNATAAPTSAPGAYPIVPAATGSKIASYTVATVNGILTIAKATPAIALSTSASSAPSSTSVVFTANMTASGSGAVPTGMVSFYDDTALLGTGALVAGIATLANSTLSIGTHAITAVYGGDINYNNVTSSTLNQAITTGFTLTTSGGGNLSATITQGGQATYTLTITPPANTTFPSAVTFAVTGLPSGATATFSPSSIPAGAATTNVTLTITLPAKTGSIPMEYPFQRSHIAIAVGLLMLPLIKRKDKWHGKATLRALALFSAVIAFATILNGCGGNSPSSGSDSGQTQNYTPTVTATSGGVSQNLTLQLTVK